MKSQMTAGKPVLLVLSYGSVLSTAVRIRTRVRIRSEVGWSHFLHVRTVRTSKLINLINFSTSTNLQGSRGPAG